MKTNMIGIRFIAIVLFVPLVMVSCKINNSISATGIDSNALYRTTGSVAADTATIADIPWREYFNDATLRDLISEALSNNINLQVALSRIKQSEAAFGMARGANLPNVGIGAMGNATRISSGKDGTKVLGYNTPSSPVLQLGFTASWEINLWGKLSSQTKAKYASFLASQEYRNLIQTNVVAGVARSYYALMALDEQLRITKETVELLRKSTETMEALKEAGQVTGAAVEQSKALLFNTQLTLPVLESNIRQQENAICALLGRVPGPVNRSSIDSQSDAPKLNHGVPAQMMARRPDVKQAELSLRAAFEMTNAANAGLYPSFILSTASLGYASGTLADFFNPANIAATIAGGLTQPLLYKKQLKGNLLIARAQQEEALLNFKNSLIVAGQEVSDILFGYHAALGKDTLRNEQITALTNAVDFTQQLLMAGEATYTEVLTAQQSLLNAQLGRVGDRLEQLNYSVSLYKALGGGWR